MTQKKILALPHTRKLARVLGVDLSVVKATGPQGRVTDADVRRFREKNVPMISFAASRHGGETRETPDGFEEVMPMAEFSDRFGSDWQKRSPVPAAIMDEADVTKLVSFCIEQGAKKKFRLSVLPFVLKAIACAMPDFPVFNSEPLWEENKIVVRHFVNLGISIESGNRQSIPVLRNVGKKSVLELAVEIADFESRGIENKLLSDDQTASRFLVMPFEWDRVRFSSVPLVSPFQAGIGVGRIDRRPEMKNRKISEKFVLPLSLGFDHQAAGMKTAGSFLGQVIRELEHPTEKLLAEL